MTDRFFAAIRAAICRDLGAELSAGTTVVASVDRENSPVVVAYPMGPETVVWCSPQLRPRLDSLGGSHALSGDEFVTAAVALGGQYLGVGNHRLLIGAPRPPAEPSPPIVELDRDDENHRAMIARLIDGCSELDLSQADLHVDKLDAKIVAVLDGSGEIASLASVRPWFFDADFDDVAVITHPAHRGRGFGVAAVATLSLQQQQRGRMITYNCKADNAWSNRVADSVGFQLVNTVVAVSFDENCAS